MRRTTLKLLQEIAFYGDVGLLRRMRHDEAREILDVLEKPTPAPLNLTIQGASTTNNIQQCISCGNCDVNKDIKKIVQDLVRDLLEESR